MKARLYLNLGLVSDSLREPAQRDHFLKKSIFLAEQGGLQEDLYRAHFNRGSILLRDGDPTGALRSLSRARECARSLGDRAMESECCAGSGRMRSPRVPAVLPPGGARLSAPCPAATRVLRLLRALEEAGGDAAAALPLCEQLGDTCSRHGDYARALAFYQRQLGLAQALARPPRELAVIHVSLATTFGDLRDPARALHHFRQELALHRGDALEVRPLRPPGGLWALGCSLGSLGAHWGPWGHPLAAPQRPVAPHSAPERPLARAARDAAALWPAAGAAAAAGGAAQGRGRGRGRREPRPPGGAGGRFGVSPPPHRSSLPQWNRRNERGETPLHRACIEGDLRRVRLLLQQGHPVNPRDYCGWTPLHEACNHGHLEIVRELLARGAARDDPGGPGCDGVTPLHDALSCGHFEVAQLLLQHGASVSARDSRWSRGGQWGL
uniref:Uncharacterized protein n=1 Tax=Strigops habroptila TaxID=2489341 RepID=A0A672TI44_STRHB